MTVISNNDIARSIYLMSKDKSNSECVALSQKIVKFLSRRRLLSKAGDIISRLEKMIDKERGRIVVKVSSATKLNHKNKTHLENNLKKRYSAKEVMFKESIDPGLIGGTKIEVNDEVIDLSIKNRLEKLQTHLTKSV